MPGVISGKVDPLNSYFYPLQRPSTAYLKVVLILGETGKSDPITISGDLYWQIAKSDMWLSIDFLLFWKARKPG